MPVDSLAVFYMFSNVLSNQWVKAGESEHIPDQGLDTE